MKRWTFDENTIILPNGLKVITIKKNKFNKKFNLHERHKLEIIS